MTGKPSKNVGSGWMDDAMTSTGAEERGEHGRATLEQERHTACTLFSTLLLLKRHANFTAWDMASGHLDTHLETS